MTDDHLNPKEQMLVTDELVGRVVHYLGPQRSGPESSSEIAAQLDILDGPTHPVVRAAIAEALRQGLAPICASSTGYFTATQENDVEAYAKELEHRAEAIRARAHNVRRAWQIRQGDEAMAANPLDRARVLWVPDPEEEA